MKFFTKEVKIALTAIVAAALLFFIINFFKGINLFSPTNHYVVRFDNVAGLTVSAPVYANGYPVGTVRSISYDYASRDRVMVDVELDDEMRIPAGTRAELASQMLGGVTMSLILGPNPADVLSPGDTVEGGVHQGAIEKLEAMMPVIETMVPKIDSILTNINRLTGDPALAATLQNAAALTADLRTTTRQLNTLMENDVPQLTAHLNQIGANVETLSGNLAQVDVKGTVDNVNATLRDAQGFVQTMNSLTQNLDSKMRADDNSLGLLLSDRQLYDNLNSTVRSADSLLIDLRQHPKRYVHFSLFGRKDK
ncbi:virulence factor Mce family protein [Prevotella sp. CAG:755]|nr:virulence factor Mce family protein [Prevotella sp. CAG:755]